MKIIKTLLLCLFFIAINVSLATAATYYVSETGDNSAPTTDCTTGPMDVSDFNAGSFSGGDTIYICGKITSRMVIPSSGSEGNQIIIRGDSSPAGESEVSDDNFYLGNKSYITIRNLTIDSNSDDAINFEGGTSLIFHDLIITSTDRGFVTANGIGTTNGLDIYNNTITYDGSHTANGDIDAIDIRSYALNVNIYRNTIIDFQHCGICFYAVPTASNPVFTNIDVYENEVRGTASMTYGRAFGISTAAGDISSFKVHHNYFHDLHASDNINGDGVEIYNNIYSGIENADSETYSGWKESDLWAQHGYYMSIGGYDTWVGHNIKIYNNVFYDAQETCLRLGSDSGTDNIDIQNNIFMNCSSNPIATWTDTSAAIHINDQNSYLTSTGNNITIKNNLFYGTNGSGDLSYNNDGDSYAEFFDAPADGGSSGLNTADIDTDDFSGNIGADPLFTAAGTDDFTLTSPSPAINAGLDLGDSYDDAFMPESSLPPAAATTGEQDSYGAGWEIGTYIFDENPAIVTTTIEINGTTLTIVFNENVTQGAGYADADLDIDCTTAGDNVALTYSSGNTTTTHAYTIASTILGSETCTLDFNGDTNSLEDGDGNDVEAIVDGEITNNSSQTPPAEDPGKSGVSTGTTSTFATGTTMTLQ